MAKVEWGIEDNGARGERERNEMRGTTTRMGQKKEKLIKAIYFYYSLVLRQSPPCPS